MPARRWLTVMDECHGTRALAADPFQHRVVVARADAEIARDYFALRLFGQDAGEETTAFLGAEAFRPQRLLFTRLDETNSLGPIFNEAVRTSRPLSFFTAGQRIPEDLEVASHRRLIEAILGSRPAEAFFAA